MKFDDAVAEAKSCWTNQIWQESKPWHKRGIETEFTEEEKEAVDWESVPLPHGPQHIARYGW